MADHQRIGWIGNRFTVTRHYYYTTRRFSIGERLPFTLAGPASSLIGDDGLIRHLGPSLPKFQLACDCNPARFGRGVPLRNPSSGREEEGRELLKTREKRGLERAHTKGWPSKHLILERDGYIQRRAKQTTAERDPGNPRRRRRLGRRAMLQGRPQTIDHSSVRPPAREMKRGQEEAKKERGRMLRSRRRETGQKIKNLGPSLMKINGLG